MLVYGKNILFEVNKKKIKKAYISRNDYISYLKENSIKYEIVDKSRLDKMVKGVHQGIVLDIFDYNYYTMDDLEGDFVVILDHLTDPHNFGAIIRTCESKNIKSIIIPKTEKIDKPLNEKNDKTLKLYKDLYSTFVAVDEESGQDSFFEKGIHLLVTGVQRGSTFVPKTYKNTGRKSVMKINIDNQNNFINLEEKVSVEPGN